MSDCQTPEAQKRKRGDISTFPFMCLFNTRVFRMAYLTSFLSDVHKSVSYLLDNKLLVFCHSWGSLVARPVKWSWVSL